MLVEDMLENISSSELIEWMAHYKLKEFERKMELDRSKRMSGIKRRRGR